LIFDSINHWYNGRNTKKGKKFMSKDTVQDGVVVSMDYKLTVDGEVLDSSDEAGPLQFLAGYGNIIPGLEQEMMGMKIGESKDVVVQPEDGYGEFDEEAFMDVPRSEFPADMQLEEGLELHVTDEDGNHQAAYVSSFDDKSVSLDFNHPLAGAVLNFSVKVVGLREPTEEELDHGHVHEGGGHHH
jgi:FKBP-type peptidyl-prolyl cis-trans isomerase SlyD